MLKQIVIKIRLLAPIVFSFLIAACASTGGDNGGVPNHEQLYRDALQALSEGHEDKALQLLDASSRANPAYAEPWVKMAQIYFDESNYPMAIKSADEATKRDPNRRETKAIAVVASLRVAMQALGEMREDANLRGNTRAEAENLAKTLRETLSIEQIVPTGLGETQPAPPPAPKVVSHSRPHVVSKPAPRAPVRKAAKAPAEADDSPNDPFKVLK